MEIILMKRQTICCLALLTGCIHPESFEPGTYCNQEPTVTEQALYVLKSYSSYTMGTVLELSPDSGFRYSSCGTIMTGTWHLRGDSLFLQVKSNRWRKERLNLPGTSLAVPSAPMGFRVIKNGLERLSYTKNGRKSINKLVKCSTR